jgi:hypothetical protein
MAIDLRKTEQCFERLANDWEMGEKLMVDVKVSIKVSEGVQRDWSGKGRRGDREM